MIYIYIGIGYEGYLMVARKHFQHFPLIAIYNLIDRYYNHFLSGDTTVTLYQANP